MWNCQYHYESGKCNQHICAYNQFFPMVSVCPYAAYKRNEKLWQIGTDCKCGNPRPAGCLHGRIPNKCHLNKCRAKKCNTLAGQEKKYSFLQPVCCVSSILHILLFFRREHKALCRVAKLCQQFFFSKAKL